MDININSFNDLPDIDNKPKNHPNLPREMFQVVSGVKGAGKTFLVMTEILAPNFIDYQEIYFLTPNLNKIENVYLRKGFERDLSKETMFNFRAGEKKFRPNQFTDVWNEIAKHNPSNEQPIKHVFTSKPSDIPHTSEMDETFKLFIVDDCGKQNYYNDVIEDLVLRGRSYNCMVIMLVQDFIQVPPTIRRQTDCLVFFKTEGTCLDRIYTEMAQSMMPDKKKFLTYCNRYWKDKHDYVYINKSLGQQIITNNIFNEAVINSNY